MNTNTRVSVVAGDARGFYLNRTLSAAAAAMLTVVWLAAAQPAQARELAISTTTVVYSDLNLQTEAGARTLYQRLKMAAARVCGVVDYRDHAWRQCYNKALADAVNEVGAPTLLAVHRKAGGDAASSG